jgi:hypothetical protein
VRTPKIGSRGALFCFGGIWGFHADLRRELVWGIWDLGVFEVLFGFPRGTGEEGGALVVQFCAFGGILASIGVGFVGS